MTCRRAPAILAMVLFAIASCESGDEAQGQGSGSSQDVVTDAPEDVSSADGLTTDGDATGDASPEADSADFDPEFVWVDEAAGLIWQREAASVRMNVEAALLYCSENQGELPGIGWRLPNVTELRTLVRGCPATEAAGACELTESCTSFDSCWSTDCWSTCMLGDGPGGCYREQELEGSCSATWSSDGVDDQMGRYWYLGFRNGGLQHDLSTEESEVRCVRWLQ
jgi:hypothetical protein